MVNIYLSINGSPLSLLTIPNSEAESLSIRPFKWMRYVMFSICGAFGDLSSSPPPNGPSVDYDSTSLADVIDLYYNPSGKCIFVDYNCLVERATTSGSTPRRSDFRKEVVKRDGESCVITGRSPRLCDAAHIIPRCKTDQYLARVVGDRLALYNPRPPSIDGVDDIQNGVLLAADLHRSLSEGEIALLKTPNYGLDPTDIRRFERAPASTSHITLHQLKKPDSGDPVMLEALTHSGTLHPHAAFVFGAHVDAFFNGINRSLHPPHVVVLDYMYGVAAYARWRSTADIHDVMKAYHTERYAHIPAPPRKFPSVGSDDAPEPEDTGDADCRPPKRHHPSTSRGNVMVEAMDDLNLILMLVNGTTPEEVAERMEKRMEEEERAAQETSRSKVTEWMRYTDVVGS
ncbi:hypothetical protein EDB85DRAFT_2290152 [Lactarius pseudohatsudake]|nr:hypothetical protein EDB85DRAFT_2290152 [Lactarius pseudohatsudake]